MRMPPPEEIQACRLCAKAKRRCGKEQPTCRRCRLRGELCEYPAKLQARSGMTPASDRSATLSAFEFASPVTSTSTATIGTREHSPQTTRQCLSWYLGENTWSVEQKDETMTPSTSFSSVSLRRFVTNLKQWLTRWTSTGECPFIHSQLYIALFPTDLQVAYATFISYINRVPGNAEIVLRIVEDQVSKLVAESGATPGAESCFAGSSDETNPRARASLLDQLARLQALIIYQVIGLFDGDIRLRHLAEGRLALLLEWSRHLLDSARQRFAASPAATIDITLALQNGPMDSLEHPWYLWVLTESIRRTWLVATGIEGIYYMMQRGWHPCPGGVMLTTRQGIWSAKCSQAWEKLCTEQDVGFMRRFEIDRLFVDARPEEVDEFTQVMMEITFGLDRADRWKST